MKRMRAVDAIYRRPGICHYDGNPFIEALPPIMSLDEATTVLSVYPKVHPEELQLAPHVRRHCVGRLFGLVQAAPIYIDFLWSFDELLRGGYVVRDPFSSDYQSHLYSKQNEGEAPVSVRFAATSGLLMLQGASGQGKSTLVARVLSCYPQVIQHRSYEGKKIRQTQVVWLKVTCPHDGSLRELCMAFFQALDMALGTTYADQFTHGRYGIPSLLSSMQQLCKTYYVGALVIDELQHLSLAKAGGKRKMMNFFVNLVNDVGVPLMLIGTYAAASLFIEAMRDARRATGDGLKDFRRPSSRDAWWNLLVESVWEYQWTNKRADLNKNNIRHLLYDLTQGITDFLIKLVALSQRRALRLGRSAVMDSDLKYVANNELVLLKPAIAALRVGTPEALRRYEDLLPTKDVMAKHLEALEAASKETAEDLLNSLRRARDGAQNKSSQTQGGQGNELHTEAEEKFSEIRACGAHQSLLSSLGAADVADDLFARGLIVEAMD